MGKVDRGGVDALVLVAEVAEDGKRRGLVQECEVTCKEEVDTEGGEKVGSIAEGRARTGVSRGGRGLRGEEGGGNGRREDIKGWEERVDEADLFVGDKGEGKDSGQYGICESLANVGLNVCGAGRPVEGHDGKGQAGGADERQALEEVVMPRISPIEYGQ